MPWGRFRLRLVGVTNVSKQARVEALYGGMLALFVGAFGCGGGDSGPVEDDGGRIEDAGTDVDAEAGGDEGADAGADAGVDGGADADAGADGDADGDVVVDVVDPVEGRLLVEFETGQPPGTAGGVRARAVYIWVEDSSGRYVDTILQYFGRVTVGCAPTDTFYACSGYRYYDDDCIDWHTTTGETGPIATDPLVPPDVTGTALNVDGVTGATPLPRPGGLPGSSGTITAPEWDCRDRLGNPIPRGDYVVQIEITWERADGLGHRRPCETYPGEFPCHFRYSAPITLGTSSSSASIRPNDWMLSSGTVTFTTR